MTTYQKKKKQRIYVLADFIICCDCIDLESSALCEDFILSVPGLYEGKFFGDITCAFDENDEDPNRRVPLCYQVYDEDADPPSCGKLETRGDVVCTDDPLTPFIRETTACVTPMYRDLTGEIVGKCNCGCCRWHENWEYSGEEWTNPSPCYAYYEFTAIPCRCFNHITYVPNYPNPGPTNLYFNEILLLPEGKNNVINISWTPRECESENDSSEPQCCTTPCKQHLLVYSDNDRNRWASFRVLGDIDHNGNYCSISLKLNYSTVSSFDHNEVVGLIFHCTEKEIANCEYLWEGSIRSNDYQ